MYTFRKINIFLNRVVYYILRIYSYIISILKVTLYKKISKFFMTHANISSKIYEVRKHYDAFYHTPPYLMI